MRLIKKIFNGYFADKVKRNTRKKLKTIIGLLLTQKEEDEYMKRYEIAFGIPLRSKTMTKNIVNSVFNDRGDVYKEEENIGFEIVSILKNMGFTKAVTSAYGPNTVGIEIENETYEFSIDKNKSILLKNVEGFNYKTNRPTIRPTNKKLGKVGTYEFIQKLEDELI